MNFSNPKPIQSNFKKGNPIKAMFEKAWAGLSMVSLTAVPGANTRENLPAKNIGIICFVVILTYLSACGIYKNIQWLKHVEFSGSWFYYTGIAVLLFVMMEFFNMEKQVREFALNKKLPYINRQSIIEKIIGKSAAFNIFSSLMEAVSFFWVILGIIAFDRILFIALLITSIIFPIITTQLKKTQHAKVLCFIQSMIAISILSYIIYNHFGI